MVKRAALTALFCLIFSSVSLAQDSASELLSQLNQNFEKARDFVSNSKVVPDFNNTQEWAGPGNFGYFYQYVTGGNDDQASTTDEMSWIRVHSWQLRLIFVTREYVNRDHTMVVRVYSFWNGKTYDDVAMYYVSPVGDNNEFGRTAVRVNGAWHVNASLYDRNNSDSDLKPLGAAFDPKTFRPIQAMFSFQSLDGEKELILNFPQDPDVSSDSPKPGIKL